MKALLKGTFLLVILSCTAYPQVLPWRTLLNSGLSNFLALETDTTSKTVYITDFDHLIRIDINSNTIDTVYAHMFSTVVSLGQGLLFAAYFGTLGIFKSTDNGSTWTGVFPYWRITDIFYDGYRLWATNVDGALLFSDDKGDSWETNSFNINRPVISLCSDSPYVYLGTAYSGGYYYSDNYGSNWYQFDNFYGPGYICKDSNNNLYLTTSGYLMFSSDHGSTWEQRASLDPSPEFLTIDPFDNLYYSGSWGGFYKSTDKGINWIKISTFTPSKVEFIDSSIFIMNTFYLLAYTPGFTYDIGSNMFPMSLNNKYQFMYHQSYDGVSTYDLKLREIINDTTMDEHEYYLFNNTADYYRYQKDSNLAYIRYGDIEGLYVDFNLYNGQTFMQLAPYSHTYREVNVETGSGFYFGETRMTFKWWYNSNGSHTDQLFAENLGIIHEYSSWSYPAGGGSTYQRLIGAFIKDSLGNEIFCNEGYKPEIIFEPFYTLDLAPVKNLTATINHEYNRHNSNYGEITDGILFVDSAYFEYFYKKDTIETSKQKRMSYRTPLTYVYHFTVFIDTTLIQNGYKLYYRIVASDIALIPQYSCSPDSGYYVAEYNPVSTLNDQKIPYSFTLEQNYPNPFNPATSIKFSVPLWSLVVIKVFDVLGNEIKTIVNEEKSAGNYKVNFNASDLPSGIYLYRMQSGNFIKTKKMILLK